MSAGFKYDSLFVNFTESGSVQTEEPVQMIKIIFISHHSNEIKLKPFQMNLESFYFFIFVFFMASSRRVSIEIAQFHVLYSTPLHYTLCDPHSLCVYSNVVKTQHSWQSSKEK